LQHGSGTHAIRWIRGIFAKNPHPSGVTSQQPEQQLHSGGFTCSVWTQQRDHLAGAYGEVYLPERLDISVTQADCFQTRHNVAGVYIGVYAVLRSFESFNHDGNRPPLCPSAKAPICPGVCIIPDE
jgi:hypothetical protein